MEDLVDNKDIKNLIEEDEPLKELNCPICYEDAPATEFVKIWNCSHQVMKVCLVEYINYQISNNKDDFLCPIEKCGQKIPLDFIQC